MIFKNIICIVLACFFVGQISAQDVFRKTELESFAKVYMEQAKSQTSINREVIEVLKKHKVSNEVYRKLYTAESRGELGNISANEKSCLSEIAQIKAEKELKDKAITEELVSKSDLSLELYYKIFDRYKTDREFKQEVRVYFE